MDHILSLLVRLIVFLSSYAKVFSHFGLVSYEEWKPGQPIKILLVGYNGARNTGADARVVAIVRQIKEVFGADWVEITLMTLNKKSLEGYFPEDVHMLEFSSIFFWDLFKACCAHHAAILCEGSTLKSTFANALTMFFCQAAGIMGKQNKPCMAYGSEIGDMDAFLKKLACDMCKDTYFISRSEQSQSALEELGLNGHLGTDTAWIYDQAAEEGITNELLLKAGWDGSSPLLGIAVIDPFCWPVRSSIGKYVKGRFTGNLKNQYDKWYFYSDSPKRRLAYRHYINSIAKAVLKYREEEKFFPVLIGMERMDQKACRDLQRRMDIPCGLFVSENYSASIMVGILNRLSMLVTSRYHGAVLSMESACPIIAVSMDERLDGLMTGLSLQNPYLLHVTDSDLARKVYACLRKGQRNHKEIEDRILRKRVAYQKILADMGIYLYEYIKKGLR